MEKSGRARHIAQEQGKRKTNMLQSLSVDEGHSEEEAVIFWKPKLKSLVKRVNSNGAIFFNIKPSQVIKLMLKDLFLRQVHGIESWTSKHMVCEDEKHLRSCLEIIHISAFKAAQCNITVNLGTISESLLAAKYIEGEYFHSAGSLFYYPVTIGARSIAGLNPCSQWIQGSIMQSQSMINILRSHLFQKFAASDRSSILEGTDLNDVRGFLSYNSPDSPNSCSICSPHELVKETPPTESHTSGPKSTHKRFVSISSTTSTVSDCSSSGSAAISQGMIQCTWKGGTPQFIFSVDNQKEVYIASLQKVVPDGDNVVDHFFLFHLSKNSQKDKTSDMVSQLVGKMNVSTHFTVCPNNLKVRETEYVLYTSNGSDENDMQTLGRDHKKNKGLPKKMVEAFRTSTSSKYRKLSRFDGASPILESCPWKPSQIPGNNANDLDKVNLLETYLPSNYESAAIVVKEHIAENLQEAVGGWGLKFLKKPAVKQAPRSLDGSKTLSCCDRNFNCILGMDILIPAGLHGGPKTRIDGPSSLMERWRSGGHCNCGGWDTGCPLTVLKSRSSMGEALSPAETQGNCNSSDLYIQGSKNSDPEWRMVNVHDGFYLMNFQQPLSALQSFSIAVAIIHTQSPNLQSYIQEFT